MSLVSQPRESVMALDDWEQRVKDSDKKRDEWWKSFQARQPGNELDDDDLPAFLKPQAD